MPNAPYDQLPRNSLLDDLEEAYAVATDLVLLARQLWVVARDQSDRVEVLAMHLPNDERTVLDGLITSVERLLKSSRRTFAVMMRRGPQAASGSARDVLHRQGVFALAADDLADARARCAALREGGPALRPQVRALVDETQRVLDDIEKQFATQARHWRFLRDLMNADGRSAMLVDVFAAALPDDSTRDYDYELGNIDRHMRALHEAERRVQAEVRLARRLGASWVQIGAAAGITPQGAYRRWDAEGQRRRRKGPVPSRQAGVGSPAAAET
jgi:hypothetical protein